MTINFLIIRQYTNAKKLAIETQNRLIASKMFAHIKNNEQDDDIKKSAYPKLISAITDSPYNQNNSDDQANDLIGTLTKYIDKLSKK